MNPYKHLLFGSAYLGVEKTPNLTRYDWRMATGCTGIDLFWDGGRASQPKASPSQGFPGQSDPAQMVQTPRSLIGDPGSQKINWHILVR